MSTNSIGLKFHFFLFLLCCGGNLYADPKIVNNFIAHLSYDISNDIKIHPTNYVASTNAQNIDVTGKYLFQRPFAKIKSSK